MRDSSEDVRSVVSTVEEEGGVIGCLPSALSPSHRAEMEAIVSQLPAATADGVEPRGFETLSERFRKLVHLYEEQPNLLDPMIPSLVESLLALVTLPAAGSAPTRLDTRSSAAMQFLQRVTTARGYKTIVKLFPHQVTYLERLLLALEGYGAAEVAGDMCERQMLLLWLWIVAKNPFSLARFDGDDTGATMRRMHSIALGYLCQVANSAQQAAALVLSQCLARADGAEALPPVLHSSLALVAAADDRTLVGHLVLLLAILKHVERARLLPHTQQIVHAVHGFFPLSHANVLVRKSLVKVAQRVALVLLPPRVAAWRYLRGKRRLEDNLMHIDESPSTTNGHSAHKEEEEKGTMEEEDEEEMECSPELVEWCVDCVLKGVSDAEGVVRWSAAKGVGRIAARLPASFAKQVVEQLLDDCFSTHASHGAWHGGCLSLAELSRRGCLLPDHLPRAFQVLQKALFYEDPEGRHAVGSKVRDSACFLSWAWARAFDPPQLRPFVLRIANSLMNVALFDREVNIRRAASAAFQENVGRQAQFPDGIELLTLVDYFAVGVRAACFEKLCVRVAEFPRYRQSIIQHLLAYKVCHWDVAVRCEAASALEALCGVYAEGVRAILPALIQGINDSNVARRHGYMVGVAHCVRGLRACGDEWDEGQVCEVADVPGRLRMEIVRLGLPGVELTRMALVHLIQLLSQAGMPLTSDQKIQWLEVLEMTACHPVRNRAQYACATVAERAHQAARPFFIRYMSGAALEMAQKKYTAMVVGSKLQHERVGACLLASCIPPSLVDEQLFQAVNQLTTKIDDTTKEWAYARQAAVRTVSAMLDGEGSWSPRCDAAWSALLRACDDYTRTTAEGDVGRLVRAEAMRALDALATHAPPDCTRKALDKMLQQSAEKTARTREAAAECMCGLMWGGGCDWLADEERARLESVYADASLFLHDSHFASLLAPLLPSPLYRLPLLRGLALSAGTGSEGTKRSALHTVLAYLQHTDDEQHDERSECVLSVLLSMLGSSVRLSSSALAVLPSVLGQMRMLESRPDDSQSLMAIMQIVVKWVGVSTGAARMRACLSALAATLHCPQDSQVWNMAVKQLCCCLEHTLPVVRRSSAEALYEGLLMCGYADEEVLGVLSETCWHASEPHDMDAVLQAAATVTRTLCQQQQQHMCH